MPLCTQIIRDGTPITLNWGDFHVAAMILATLADEKPMSEVMHYTYPDKDTEYAGKTQDDYPAIPCPINWGIAFQLTSYGVIGNTRLNDGAYTLKHQHRFIDVSDGELLTLEPGDVLEAWRSF